HMEVFEQLATGPFALRVAPMIPAEDQARLRVLGRDDLKTAFLSRSPQALFTGLEGVADDELLSALHDIPMDRRPLPLTRYGLHDNCALWIPQSPASRPAPGR